VLHAASLESYASLFQVIDRVQPDECYHLAAQSFVSYSFEDEFSTISTNVNGTHFVLSALKERAPHCRFYFAASSEMFGNAPEVPQHEYTPFYPRSSYGISKVAGFHLTRNYREAYDLYALSGLLFNQESPRRGLEFVPRKIVNAVAKIKRGLAKEVRLGNLNAKRDWGYAGDYVKAMWLMLQQETPEDYVIATGETHTVQELVQVAFGHVALDWQDYVLIDEQLYRPAETHELRGDASKARRQLGWTPTIAFRDLVHMMIDAKWSLSQPTCEGARPETSLLWRYCSVSSTPAGRDGSVWASACLERAMYHAHHFPRALCLPGTHPYPGDAGLKTRYRGSMLRRLWTLLNPLLHMGIYAPVFSGYLRVQSVP
jgi:GDPmannose 4,6-dehydratase